MVKDVFEEMSQTLKNIEQAVGGAPAPSSENKIKVSQMGSAKSLTPDSFIITETDDLDEVDPGGTVHLEPGDRKPLVEWEAQGANNVALLAVGADDAVDVQYELLADYNTTIGSKTNSPLGSLNSPFSFVETLNGYVPASRTIQYVASLPNESNTTADLAARLFIAQHPPTE